jgi:hypothetical protein
MYVPVILRKNYVTLTNLIRVISRVIAYLWKFMREEVKQDKPLRLARTLERLTAPFPDHQCLEVRLDVQPLQRW